MLIIFDLDDTLIDTYKCIVPTMLKQALLEAIKKGYQIKNFEKEYEKLLKIDRNSKSSKDTFEKFFKNDSKFLDIVNKAYISLYPNDIKIFTLKGVKKILKELSENHKLAIVTKGNKKFQLFKIKKAGIDSSLFSKIEVTQKENKGIFYKKIIDELGYKAEDCFVCADKIKVDLKPAKELGITTIHMKWGRSRKEKKDENVDFQIKNFEEIKQVLKIR
ncbi:MAG: HAD family hydrolase [Parachlamydiales bacterium]|nr:HAD family hydrolase [Parachlamydiales bacterium]